LEPVGRGEGTFKKPLGGSPPGREKFWNPGRGGKLFPPFIILICEEGRPPLGNFHRLFWNLKGKGGGICGPKGCCGVPKRGSRGSPRGEINSPFVGGKRGLTSPERFPRKNGGNKIPAAEGFPTTSLLGIFPPLFFRGRKKRGRKRKGPRGDKISGVKKGVLLPFGAPERCLWI